MPKKDEWEKHVKPQTAGKNVFFSLFFAVVTHYYFPPPPPDPSNSPRNS